jgi:hypothetical protein
MKTKLLILCMFLGGLSVSRITAQKNRMELIKEEKMIFINDYCKFTDDEAKKFWPLHDEMQDKLKEIKRSMRRELRDIKDKGVDNVSETDLKKAMDNRKGYEQKQLDVKWEYNDKFVAIVGVKKTAKFYEGEIAFRKKLLDRLKDLKMDGKGDEEEDDN